jgi:hypothetical protein
MTLLSSQSVSESSWTCSESPPLPWQWSSSPHVKCTCVNCVRTSYISGHSEHLYTVVTSYLIGFAVITLQGT